MSILWNPAEATVVEKVSLPVITTGTQNMGDGIYWLKAGTPLSNAYAVANNGNAKYIVAEDFFFVTTNPNQERSVPLVKAGYVDINKAEAAAGITLADAAKSALKTAGIELVDGLLETGGGSDLPSIGSGDKNKFLHTNSSTGDLEWDAVNELPDIPSSGYLNKVPMVGNGKEISWEKPFKQFPTSSTETGFLIDEAANVVYGALYDGWPCTFVSPSYSVGTLLGVKDDMSEFYAMYNGSIITFTAENGDAYPTYTP